MPAANATSRFSDRVENYVRYRPGYPSEVIDTLKAECGLKPEHVIADIASGTGIWTRVLLENGNQVFGVEPNSNMRLAGERLLADFPTFSSVAGSAEATTLPDRSVDFVTAAQAGHWFDRPRSRREFVRILKPVGWLVLLWNERGTDSTPFLSEYEQLLERVFPLRQEFDYVGLEGRLLSSSYTPDRNDPTHAAMLRELRRIFDKHQQFDRVLFEYTTRIYFGQMT